MARDKKVNVKINVDDRNAKKRLGGFSRALLNIKSIIGAGIGLAILNKGLKETVGRAQSAESGLKRLGVAMQSAGRFTDENLQSFERLAVQLERTTGFMEEDVLQALAVLQTFGQMTRADMEKTIVASLNMATVFNEDLTQASIRLGKAYNGQLIGLQRMGVGISKAKFNAEGFSAVLDQLGKEQGGQAVARMKGFEGAVLRVGVGFGEVGKEAGKLITKSRGLRSILDSLAGGFQIMAKGLRNYRLSTKETSSRVKELIKDLNDQRKAMFDVGQQADVSVLASFKQDLIDAQSELDLLNEKLKVNILPQQRHFDAIVAARRAVLKLEAQILILESDQNVQGSEANKIERDRLKLLKERAEAEEALLKTAVAAFKERKKTDDLNLTIKTNDTLREKLKLAKEQESAEKAELKRLQDLFGENEGFAKLIEQSAERRIHLTVAVENAEAALLSSTIDGIQRGVDAKDRYADAAEKASDDVKQAEEDLLKHTLDFLQKGVDSKDKYVARIKKAEDALLKHTLARLQDRVDARESANARSLRLVISAAKDEMAALERLQAERTSRISAANREILTGDQANQSERSQVFAALEADAESLDAKLAAAGTDAIKLEQFKQQMDAVSEAIKGVTDREAEDLRDQLREVGAAFDEAVVAAGGITTEELFDIAALRAGVVQDMTALGTLAGKTFGDAVKRELASFQLNVDTFDFSRGFTNL